MKMANCNIHSCSSCKSPECVDRCYKHSDCPSKGDFCTKNGHCKNSCQSAKDCPKKKNFKEICKNGLCHYIRVGCDSDSHCPKGLFE